MKKLLGLLVLSCLPTAAFAGMAEDYFNAGLGLFKQGDNEKAIQYFQAALQERPDYWQAYQFMGEAYYQSSNRTEALLDMELSLKLNPHNPDLSEFVARIKRAGPWMPTASWTFSDSLSTLAILLSLFTLGWPYYRRWRNREKSL
jgi:tetratricopeptide (TPR) repeat protein